VKREQRHAQAREILARAAQVGERFVTTDYVLDESATLLKARGHGYLLQAFFGTVFASTACRLEWMDSDRFDQTRRFFLKHRDQAWSFTDCFSFWLMRQLGLREALTTDEHFGHAGFKPLLL
jgi:predicted nucleic acid-binding protein